MLGPLLDRIEIISVPAYLPVEKINIAKNYLIPKFEEEYGFHANHESNEKVVITDAALIDMINSYCGFEAGVRNLRKCVDRVFRKIVAKLENKKIDDEKANAKTWPTSKEEYWGAAEAAHHLVPETDIEKQYQVNTQNLETFLDVNPTDDNYYHDINKQLNTGCSNGLAYVDDGYGAVLKIQFVKKWYASSGQKNKGEQREEDPTASSDEKGKGTHEVNLTHTGRLGDVMRESLDVVKIAVFNYI